MTYGGRTAGGFTGDWKYFIQDVTAYKNRDDDFEQPDYDGDFVFNFFEYYEGDVGYAEARSREAFYTKPTQEGLGAQGHQLSIRQEQDPELHRTKLMTKAEAGALTQESFCAMEFHGTGRPGMMQRVDLFPAQRKGYYMSTDMDEGSTGAASTRYATLSEVDWSQLAQITEAEAQHLSNGWELEGPFPADESLDRVRHLVSPEEFRERGQTRNRLKIRSTWYATPPMPPSCRSLDASSAKPFEYGQRDSTREHNSTEANCIDMAHERWIACKSAKNLGRLHYGSYYMGMAADSPMRTKPGYSYPDGLTSNAQKVRLAYIAFRRNFVAALQHCHNGLLMNEEDWNAAFAKLPNVPASMKKYHPNFLKQFDASEADKSATIRSRIWRVPGKKGIASGEASIQRRPCGYCKCGDAVRNPADCTSIKGGGVPVLDAVGYALQIMGDGQGANAPDAVVSHPRVTLGVSARTADSRRERAKTDAGTVGGIAEGIAHGHYAEATPTSLHWEMNARGQTVLQFAMRLYTDWIRYRCFYIEREDNQDDEINWSDFIKDPDAEYARVRGEVELNIERAEVRAEIALGKVQKAAFREQCFMLSKIFPLVKYKKTKLDSIWGKKLPYLKAQTYHKSAEQDAGCVQYDSHGGMTNACLQIDGSTFGFMNLLTADPKMMPLYQAHHSQLSALQPMMRFFKVVEDTVDGEEFISEQEIDFDAYESNYLPIFSPQQMLRTANQRGHGVGVKSFDFTYDGSNPFAVKKSIKAKLVIFANSFDELMRIRGTQDKPYRYIDLALKTGGPRLGDVVPAGYRRGNSQQNNSEDPLDCIPISNGLAGDYDGANITTEEDALDKLNFRLKAVVGYAPPPPIKDETFWNIGDRGNRLGDYLSYGNNTASQYKSIEAAVNSSFVSLNLTPTTHDFKFDEMGRVTFTINYLAYIEDFFDDRNFNIFTDLEIAKFMLFRRLRMDKLKKACKTEEINEIKKKEKDEIEEFKIDSMKILTQNLFTSGRVHYLNIDYAQLRNWRSDGPYADVGDLSAVSGQAGLDISEAKDATERIAQDASAARTEAGDDDAGAAKSERLFTKYVNDYNDQNIPFFYVADLVDSILEGLDAYLADSGMQAIVKKINRSDGLPGVGKEFITECDKAYEVYKLKKFADQYRRYRTVLGPVEIINPIDVSKSLFVNFGDIPVSVKYFNEWLTAKLLKKDRAVYTLPRFLNDFFNHLLRNFLNNDTCFNYNIKQKIKLNQAAITDYCSPSTLRLSERTSKKGNAPAGIPMDTLTHKTLVANHQRRAVARIGGRYTPLRLVPASDGAATIVQAGGYGANGELKPPILNIAGATESEGGMRDIVTSRPNGGRLENETNYMIFYAGRSKPTEFMKGHLPTDMQNGIMHYNQGQDVGVVKKIDLKKTNSPGLAEVRFEQDGYDGLEQLRVLYDTTITTFCLPNAVPGQYLYVDPRSFSPSEGAAYGEKFDLTRFGIGGYFMAHKVEHRLAPGVAETTIHAKWVAEVSKEPPAAGAEVDDPIPGQGDDARDPALISKCTAVREERKAQSLGGATVQVSNEPGDAERDTVGIAPAGD